MDSSLNIKSIKTTLTNIEYQSEKLSSVCKTCVESKRRTNECQWSKLQCLSFTVALLTLRDSQLTEFFSWEVCWAHAVRSMIPVLQHMTGQSKGIKFLI